MDILEELLTQQLPDELFQITEHGKKVEAYRFRLSMRLVEEKKVLVEEVNRFQMIKTPRITEMDRKQYTDYHTREQKLKVEKIERTLECIDKRISYIQSLLKTETEVFKRT